MENQISPSAVNELIRSRRSTFNDQFEIGKKIPDEIIWELLRNANNAPTHKLTEPWRFVVFTGDGLKMLAEKQAEIYKENAGASFKQDKYEKLKIGAAEMFTCDRDWNEAPYCCSRVRRNRFGGLRYSKYLQQFKRTWDRWILDNGRHNLYGSRKRILRIKP
jgi:nitroreductase